MKTWKDTCPVKEEKLFQHCMEFKTDVKNIYEINKEESDMIYKGILKE